MSRLIRSLINDFGTETTQEEWPALNTSASWLVLFWASVISFFLTMRTGAGHGTDTMFAISFVLLTIVDLRIRESMGIWTILSHTYGILMSLCYIAWQNNMCTGLTLMLIIVIGIAGSYIHHIPQNLEYFFNHYDESNREPEGFIQKIIIHSWLGALVLTVVGSACAIVAGCWRLLCFVTQPLCSTCSYYAWRCKTNKDIG